MKTGRNAARLSQARILARSLCHVLRLGLGHVNRLALQMIHGLLQLEVLGAAELVAARWGHLARGTRLSSRRGRLYGGTRRSGHALCGIVSLVGFKVPHQVGFAHVETGEVALG